MAIEAQHLVDVLLTRASLTSASLLKQQSLGRYSLYVLRYCFVDQGSTYMKPEHADRVLPIAKDLTSDRQGIFRDILLTSL